MKTPHTQDPSSYTLRDLVAAFFRQSHVAIACFVLVSAGVVAAVVTAPKVYDADMKILVKRDRADSLVSGTAQSDRAASSDVTEQELLSEAELLQGHDLLEQVVLASGLFKPPAPSEGSLDARELLARAVTGLRADLNVAPIRKTWMIDVAYTSTDPRKAKEVLDALVRLYLEKHLAMRRPPGAYQFFSTQADQSAEELRAAQVRLQEFADSNRIVSASMERESALQKLAEFEALQRMSEVTLAETTRRTAALETEVERTPARRTSAVTTSDAAGLVQEMQSKIWNLESKRTELLQKFTPQYRLVTEIDQQLAQARASLDAARQVPVTSETVAENPTMQWLENDIARSRTDRASAEARAKALHKTVEEYRSRAQTLDMVDAQQKDLQRVVKTAEEKYVLYQRKQEEARISDALDRTRIANVAIAEAPTEPLWPRRTRSLAWLPLGFIGALVLSVGAALAKDSLSSAVRTPDELEEALGVPVLAWVPADRM